MLYLIFLFSLLFFILAWRRLDLALMLLIAALPSYLIRFNIFGLPSTLLEVMVLVIFLVWFLKNYKHIIENLKLKIGYLLKIENCKLKIKNRYPFDWEIVLMLLVALAAVAVAGFSNSSFGLWKAYFFEPALFFIVMFNIINNPPRPPLKRGIKGGVPFIRGVELILRPLAVSALAVSFLAIYQKITGQFIDNSFWAMTETRRVVSFFGYPNAVGLYLGPLVLVFFGWLVSSIAGRGLICHCELDPQSRNLFIAPKSGFRLPVSWHGAGYGRNDGSKATTRNDITRIIFISLTIILSILSIYFAKSKGALVGVAVGLIVFGLMANKKIRWAIVAVTIIMAIGIAAYQPAKHEALKYLTLNDFSGQVRRAQWRETIAMLKDGRVLTGAGLANYQAVMVDYHTPGMFIKDFDDPDARRKLVFNSAYRAAHWQPLEIYLYPHNIFLNFWSELGLAGLLLFIWIIGKFFWMGVSIFVIAGSDPQSRNKSEAPEPGFRLKGRNDRFLVIGLIGAMTAVIVHGLVDVPYFKNDLAVMFWLLVAMMNLIKLEKKSSLL